MVLERIKKSLKLEQILQSFIDVLRINIFIVDKEGHALIFPRTNRYGWKILADPSFGALRDFGTPAFWSKFRKEEGNNLKFVDPFGLHTYALPIGIEEAKPLAYVVVGPLTFNKNPEPAIKAAQHLGLDTQDFTESIREVRAVSFNGLKAILGLLQELSQYALTLNYEKEKLETESRPQASGDNLFFTALLDLAMAVSGAECGSVMGLNKQTGELTIRVYKNVQIEQAPDVKVKLGEGIAGLAAQEKLPMVIDGKSGNNRIKHLLKRPDLKCALVLPILSPDRKEDVVGVLNLSTYQTKSRMAVNPKELLQSLIKMTESVTLPKN